jgi:hypothetical protein
MKKNINMKYFIFVLIILFISSCGGNKYPQVIAVDEHYCEVDTVIYTYTDSSIFGHISCMQHFKNRIYAVDVEQNQVSVFSENFDTVSFTGRFGRGPGEFSALCSPIYVYNDTLYVFNRSRVLRFYKGKYIDELISPIIRESGRFVYNSGKYYLPYPTLTSTFVMANADTALTSEFVHERLLYAGTSVKYDDEIRTIHNNHRSLLTCDGYIYLFSFNFPVIEKYDIETLELLQSFDLSNIYEIQQNLKYAESLSTLPSNTVFSFIRDGYVYDSILYLLCSLPAEIKKGVTTAILRISLYPEMKVLDILKFEGHNITLCVTSEYFFTFDSKDYGIKRYRKPVKYQ